MSESSLVGERRQEPGPRQRAPQSPREISRTAYRRPAVSREVGSGGLYAGGWAGTTTSGVIRPEGVQQLKLGLHDSGESAHTLTDAVRVGIAVGEPDIALPRAVSKKSRARHIRHSFGHRARKHRLGIHAFGQGDPDVEATVRMGPARPG